MQIIWENRKKNDIGNDCLVSVDGTDFRVEASGAHWYSHKYLSSGVRYEVGLCILSGDIVWIEGPFPCGAWPDINIFRRSIIHYLEEGERVEADDGYIGDSPLHCKIPSVMGPTNLPEYEAMESRVANRHETVNKRFKHWACMKNRFSHSPKKHGSCFRAVAVFTQLSIDFGEPLFSTIYDDTVA